MCDRACRFCNSELREVFADLGPVPLSNAFLRAEQLGEEERFYPLVAYVCERCFLVQVPAVETPQHIFGEYAYFSSYSESWLAHARDYCRAMRKRLNLGAQSHVVEVASNDGYLLQYFRELGIPVLGIEPAANVAEVARAKGIETLNCFFGREAATELAEAGRKADLLLGNNVLAHVPDLNDFVAGLAILLAPGGTITMEVPHVMRLIRGNQFDTIYHEHFSYFSLLVVQTIFGGHGLTVTDVEELPTHGGSLRIYARHATEAPPVTAAVEALLQAERAFGLDDVRTYRRFSEGARKTKTALLELLRGLKVAGKRIAAYGAPAKGNILLNYCEIGPDLIEYTVDRNPYKQGLFLPGTRIPVFGPEKIDETRPDYVLILPWNIREEITEQLKHIRRWGGRFVIPIPVPEVVT